MKTLELLQESKRKKIQSMKPKEREIVKEDDLIDLFPLPRYFQVHFQHIHETTKALESELIHLKQAVAMVDEKLESLNSLLSRHSDHVL